MFVLATHTATTNINRADVILGFQVNSISRMRQFDKIGLTDGLTEEDLILELVSDRTAIRIAESDIILGIVTQVTSQEQRSAW